MTIADASQDKVLFFKTEIQFEVLFYEYICIYSRLESSSVSLYLCIYPEYLCDFFFIILKKFHSLVDYFFNFFIHQTKNKFADILN